MHKNMHLRILSCLLMLVVCFDVVASDPYTAVNLLRKGEGKCYAAKRLAPLKPQAALESVARDLASGNQLGHSLMAAGYRAKHVNAISFRGNRIDTQLPETLAKQRYCRKLQDATMTEVGIYSDGRQVWVVIAAPYAISIDMDEQSAGQRILDLVNQTRATRRNCGNKTFNAAQPIRWNDLLANVSRLHSNDMARFDYFSHTSRDGSTFAQRVERVGYKYRAIGENIAAGQMKPDDVVADWLNSPGHCANLMNPAFTEMGVAFAINRSSKLGVFWTQQFGTPR